MRSRNIKPGFFTNEKLAEIEPLGRLLFAGLWCLADRDGRLEDRPKRIKHEVLGYDDCDVDQLLADLHDHGFIVRYGGFIQITSFKKHQNPHPKEVSFDIISHDDFKKEQEKAVKLNVKPCNYTERNLITHTSRVDSLILIPDSPIPHIESNRIAAKPNAAGLVCHFISELKKFDPIAKVDAKILGGVLKDRLKSLPYEEVKRRIDNWFSSTDPYILSSINNGGVFGQKFHQLDKPIIKTQLAFKVPRDEWADQKRTI